MAAAEPLKPFCYAVWMHGLAIILGKNKILILKIFSKPKPFSILPCSILSKYPTKRCVLVGVGLRICRVPARFHRPCP